MEACEKHSWVKPNCINSIELEPVKLGWGLKRVYRCKNRSQRADCCCLPCLEFPLSGGVFFCCLYRQLKKKKTRQRRPSSHSIVCPVTTLASKRKGTCGVEYKMRRVGPAGRCICETWTICRSSKDHSVMARTSKMGETEDGGTSKAWKWRKNQGLPSRKEVL